jgi:outer membrane murein-binding lipoprotein Lpp
MDEYDKRDLVGRLAKEVNDRSASSGGFVSIFLVLASCHTCSVVDETKQDVRTLREEIKALREEVRGVPATRTSLGAVEEKGARVASSMDNLLVHLRSASGTKSNP